MSPRTIQPDQLPGTIRSYLAAHAARRTDDAQQVDDAHWIATNRLEGDFPGGRADLSYRFALEADLIAELVIAP